MKTLRMLSLFSGIGGIDLAAHWAGIETAAFVEIDPFCQAVLRKHWPAIPIFEDVRDVTAESLGRAGITGIDIIAGGYPCQPFSAAGKRQGAADPRHLWPHFVRLVREIRPRWIVGENVSGHVSLGLDDILADLECLHYSAWPVLFPACAVGAPHQRERVFIVAHASGTGLEECDVAPVPGETGHATGRHPAHRGDGQAQSGLGGSLTRIPGRLDPHHWPAGPDTPQHAWEPPRVTTERIPHSAAQLMSLGNTVVPQQIYPVFAALVTTEVELQIEQEEVA